MSYQWFVLLMINDCSLCEVHSLSHMDGNGQDDTFLMSPVSSATEGVFAVSGGTIIESFIPTDAFGTPDPVDGQYRIREKMDGRRNTLVRFSMLSAAVLLILDIEMTGVTLRYQMDFGMLIVIPAVLILIALIRKAENSAYKNAFKIALLVLIVLGGITVFNNLFIMLGNEKARPVMITSPRMYYSLKYLFFSLR